VVVVNEEAASRVLSYHLIAQMRPKKDIIVRVNISCCDRLKFNLLTSAEMQLSRCRRRLATRSGTILSGIQIND